MCIGHGLSHLQPDQILLCLGLRTISAAFPLHVPPNSLSACWEMFLNHLECGKLLCSNSTFLVRKSNQFSSQSLLSNNGMYANKKPSCTMILFIHLNWNCCSLKIQLKPSILIESSDNKLPPTKLLITLAAIHNTVSRILYGFCCCFSHCSYYIVYISFPT